MIASVPIDAARLNLLLNELRLPAIKHLWSTFTERADKEGWPAARLLAALAEHEIAERGQRRIERHLAEAGLPPARPCPASTSTPSQPFPKPRSWRLSRGTAGWRRGPT